MFFFCFLPPLRQSGKDVLVVAQTNDGRDYQASGKAIEYMVML